MAQVILDPQDPQYGVSRPGPVTNFAIEQEFDGVRLYWTPPLNHDVDYFEIYRSNIDTFDYTLTTTTKIAEVKASNFVDQSIDTGTVYYWVRPVNNSGVYGPFTQAFITTDILVTGASGNGSTVTINISGSAPAVDSLVLISNINPITYNGYKKVTEAGSGYFKYLGIEQGTYVSGGTVRQGLGVTGASGNGTTITVTFSAQATPPFPVNSIVAVAGITPGLV